MGSGCLCGEGGGGGQPTLAGAPWQANSGPALGIGQGFYSGAVNNVLFRSRGSSTLGCGQACGQCYDLLTSGTNGYNGGVGGGSTITLMVVDSCYGQADGQSNWCTGGPQAGPVQDSLRCTDHFDIQTDPVRSDVPPVGKDGKTWSGKSTIMFGLKG